MNGYRKRVLAGGIALIVAALAGACSGGGDEAAMSGESAARDVGDGADGMPGPAAAPDSAFEDAPDGQAGESPPNGVNRTVVQIRSVIKTGVVALTARDPDAVRGRIDGVLAGVGGTLDSEQTTNDKRGDIRRSTLVLRVPVDEFDTAMGELKKLGTKQHSDVGVKDVTAEVIDIDERVQTLRNSLDRLQSYQEDAANLDDLVRFEQEITQREAELQSLKAQQAYYADQTSMSTITVHLERKAAAVEPPGEEGDAGFLVGLRNGWDALGGVVVLGLTIVGALLPFAVVLALLGVPTWLLVRRTLRARAPGSPAPPPAG